ncbi:MAG: ATP-binding cassette domain-containing protein [Opitutales bacterium]|nr:ATP-binding cassette domain-containing protein [Opitutales bacterium]
MDDYLILDNIKTYFPVYKGLIRKKQVGIVKAVDGVSLSLRKGEILGLVGESGCGKTTLSRTIMQLQPATAGRVLLDGKNLCELSSSKMKAERINVQMIFQDPYASLNPRMTVYSTLSEAIATRYPNLGRRDMLERVSTLMKTIGLNPSQMKKYPHEFSGGQRQRIAIARALAPEPKLIIADEPVSALDVSIQSQILNLLLRLTKEMNLTMIFISHDLSVVKYISDRIAVMYLGKIVEMGDAETLMENPLHYYTKALNSAVPVPDPDIERSRCRIVLQGDPPSPIKPPKGCAFAYRSPLPHTQEEAEQEGHLKEVRPGHWVEVHPATVDDYRQYA